MPAHSRRILCVRTVSLRRQNTARKIFLSPRIGVYMDPDSSHNIMRLISAAADGAAQSAQTDNIVVKLLILAVLILINAFFAMSELAVISLNDAKITKQAEEGNKNSINVLRLIKYPSKFLATI